MTSPPDLSHLYSAAKAALAAHHYDRAVELLQQILVQDENYSDASRLLARVIRLKRRKWYADVRLWTALVILGLAAIALLLVPDLRLSSLFGRSAPTRTAPAWLVAMLTPSAVPVTPTATAQPTAVPLVWKRVNLGLGWPMDPVITVAIDPHDPELMYAGTQSAGIYKSIDGGRSWHPAQKGLGRAPVRTLLLDVADPQVLYAATVSGRVYKSLDGASAWTSDDEGLELGDRWISSLLQRPTEPAVLYYTDGQGIYRKLGSGTWEQIQQSPCPQDIVALVAHPANNRMMFAIGGGPECGFTVYRSTDGGVLWEGTGLSGDTSDAIGLWIDSRDGRTLYASAGRLYRSDDEGTTWVPLPPGRCISLLIDPMNSDVAICADGDALMRSDDRGRTWRPLGFPGIWLETVVGTPSRADLLVAAGRGLFVSEDSGQTWARRNDGLGAERFLLSIDRADGSSLYGQSGDRLLFRSSDGGSTWSFLVNAPSEAQFVSSGPALFQAMPATLLHSDDQGKTWSEIDLPHQIEDRFWLSAHPQDPELLFALHSGEYAPFVYRSEDGGQSWTGSQGTPAHIEGRLFFAPSDAAVVYAAGQSHRLSRSLDGGRAWAMCSGPNAFPAAGAAALVIDPRDPAHLVVATEGRGLRSTRDGCQSWTTASTAPGSDFANALAIDPNAPDTVYAATDGGAYVSFDGGDHWNEINDGLLGATVVYSIVVDAESNVYAATPYGIFVLEGE